MAPMRSAASTVTMYSAPIADKHADTVVRAHAELRKSGGGALHDLPEVPIGQPQLSGHYGLVRRATCKRPFDK